jgi:hypothetical protein
VNDITLRDANNLIADLIDGNNVTLTVGSLTDAETGDGVLPGVDLSNVRIDAVYGNDDIVVNGTLTITATGAIGSAGEFLEIDAPAFSADTDPVITLTASSVFVDFENDINFNNLVVANATTIELMARNIVVNGDFGLPTADIELTAREQIIGDGRSTITAGTLMLDAQNQTPIAGDRSIIGELAAPILLNMTDGNDYIVPQDDGRARLTGVGFISASNFTGSDFTRIFADSESRIFLVANFTDLIASVQGSFITAQIFTIDSSQFRADLNIYGIDGAGLLLPHDQCEDEESADCAKQ